MPAALITGGGSGIGRAAALALAARGYEVAVVGRTRATLDQVVEEIYARGGKAQAIEADMAQPESAATAVTRTAENFRRLDLLINNAGYAPSVPLARMSVQQWHDVMNINISAAFYATRAAWPIMERQYAAEGAGGTIINISSMAARDPFPGLAAYGAAKAALNILTLMTAREGALSGIRAVCIAPGAVDTPMFRKFVGQNAVDPDTVLQPDDLAAAIVNAAAGSLRYAAGETVYIHRNPA